MVFYIFFINVCVSFDCSQNNQKRSRPFQDSMNTNYIYVVDTPCIIFTPGVKMGRGEYIKPHRFNFRGKEFLGLAFCFVLVESPPNQNLESRSSAGVGKSGSDWKLINVNGSNWQMVTLGLESAFISDPCQSDLLAFRWNVVGSSFVGVSSSGFVGFFSVCVFAVAGLSGQLFLGIGFVTSGAIRSSVAMNDVKRLYHIMSSSTRKYWCDYYLHAPLPSTLRTSDWLTIAISGAL